MTDMKHTSMIRRAMAVGQARIVVAFAMAALLFAAVGVFHAATRVSVVRAGYELGQAEAKYKEQLRENEHLKLERATLRSAPRLEAIARARLGLVPPAPSQLIVIKAQALPAPKPAGEKAVPDKTVAAVARPQISRNP